MREYSDQDDGDTSQLSVVRIEITARFPDRRSSVASCTTNSYQYLRKDIRRQFSACLCSPFVVLLFQSTCHK